MKFLVELETLGDAEKSQSDWALWMLKCICAHLMPEGVLNISVTPAEPDTGGHLQ